MKNLLIFLFGAGIGFGASMLVLHKSIKKQLDMIRENSKNENDKNGNRENTSNESKDGEHGKQDDKTYDDVCCGYPICCGRRQLD